MEQVEAEEEEDEEEEEDYKDDETPTDRLHFVLEESIAGHDLHEYGPEIMHFLHILEVKIYFINLLFLFGYPS